MTTIGRSRKFFYGDKVIFNSQSQIHFPRHVGHRAIIVGTVLFRPKGKKSKVNYNVECGCGARLIPKGAHMDWDADPTGEEMERAIHHLRLEHFLNLIQSTIKENKSLEQQVAKVLDPLTERDRQLLVTRFGLDGQESKYLREIAEDLGITKARVQQLEQSLLERLRQ